MKMYVVFIALMFLNLGLAAITTPKEGFAVDVFGVTIGWPQLALASAFGICAIFFFINERRNR